MICKKFVCVAMAMAMAMAMSSLAAFAGDDGRVILVLTNILTSDMPEGQIVVLVSPEKDQCRFLGTLESRVHKDESFMDKLWSNTVGNKDRSINVFRKICADVSTDVALSIPLGRMELQLDAGTRFALVQHK